jgi:hypothetical protein
VYSETITERDDLLIRRMILAPGESGPWHVDVCYRFTVVVRGCRLTIEYKGSAAAVDVEVHPGLADWDAPEPRAHRAVNTGENVYEEIVTFYRSEAGIDPQPEWCD